MPIVRYELMDVFTTHPFTGNQLAVVVDPPPLTTEQRQLVARELQLSETIYLSPRPDGGFDTTIFTPALELPFAGHPTIGAALALRAAGRVDGEVVLYEGVGPVTVTIDDGVATLTTPGCPAPAGAAEVDDVVASLGLTVADLHRDLGVRGWTAGVPYTMVTVRDVETLAGIQPDLGRWRDTVALTESPDIYAVTPCDGLRGARWRARMFAPFGGIPEDPATGSAAAAFVGYLAGHAGEDRLAEGWIIEQGIEMGRPSEILVGAVRRGPELVAATVGGRAVAMGRGELVVPD